MENNWINMAMEQPNEDEHVFVKYKGLRFIGVIKHYGKSYEFLQLVTSQANNRTISKFRDPKKNIVWLKDN